MSSSVYVAIPLMALLALLQAAVLAHLPIFGLVPQLPFLVALAWGLLQEPEEGLLWAFVAGIFMDMLSAAPLGSTSLAWMVSIFVVLWGVRVFPTSRFILPTLTAVFSTLLALLLSFLILRALGFRTSVETAVSLPLLAVLHGVVILPVYWLTYTLNRRIRPRRVQL